MTSRFIKSEHPQLRRFLPSNIPPLSKTKNYPKAINNPSGKLESLQLVLPEATIAALILNTFIDSKTLRGSSDRIDERTKIFEEKIKKLELKQSDLQSEIENLKEKNREFQSYNNKIVTRISELEKKQKMFGFPFI